MSAQTIALSSIRTDGGTQPREHNDEGVIKSYAEDLAGGADFPPLVVFFDGTEYWLADGFHRYWAAKGAKLDAMPCDVREGTRRDAVLFSVGANAAHGLRRSNEDKRKAVLTLLRDEEWSTWSDREIARQCAVGHQMVAPLREKLTGRATSERTYTDRHGNTSTMNTAAIGKRAEADQTEFESEPAPPGPAHTEPADTPPVSAEPVDPERKKLAKLTREALEDEVIGLRADLADAKRKASDQKAEIERLKSDLAAFRQDDMGRALGNAQRAARAAEGRMKEHQATAVRLDRQVKALRAENADLKSRIENQLITMD